MCLDSYHVLIKIHCSQQSQVCRYLVPPPRTCRHPLLPACSFSALSKTCTFEKNYKVSIKTNGYFLYGHTRPDHASAVSTASRTKEYSFSKDPSKHIKKRIVSLKLQKQTKEYCKGRKAATAILL